MMSFSHTEGTTWSGYDFSSFILKSRYTSDKNYREQIFLRETFTRVKMVETGCNHENSYIK